MKDRRLGRFKVTGLFMAGAQNGEGMNLFNGMIVLDCRHEWTQDFVEYVAWNPQFERVPEGQIIPEYRATLYSDRGWPRWEKVRDGDGESR